jgi:dolichol-phosphate mannosyltransferase
LHIGVVIPTYNEAQNLPRLVTALLALPLDLSVLVVDDNSPDGSGTVADQLAASSSGQVSVLHRPQKLGIASAYLQGFRSALEKRVDAIAQMDGDFSHDPVVLPTMAKRLETCELVLGSRYLRGSSLDMQWPAWRKELSSWANLYARLILRLPLHDVTTGYRLWKSETLQDMPLVRVRAKGYIFQVEMAYLACCLGYRIGEVPIHFAERRSGKSKMSFQIQFEAAWRVWQMLLTYQDIHRSSQAAQIKHVV